MFATALWLALWLSPEPLPDVCDADLDRLPSEATAEAAIKLADAYAAWLDDRRRTHGDGWGLRQLMDEAREARRPWRLLYVARTGSHDWLEPDATQSLAELRRRLGPRDYYQGVLPPPVPAGRWRNSD